MNKLRLAKKDDLKIIVDIHTKAFPGFFLTKLGPRFLYKYYNLILNYEKKIFLVAEEDGYPIGFAAGFLQPSNFYAYVRKHKNILLFALIPIYLFTCLFICTCVNMHVYLDVYICNVQCIHTSVCKNYIQI